MKRNSFVYFCQECFITQELLDKQKLDYSNINGKQTINLPPTDTFVEFESYH